jgi:hypothetical protein
MGRAQRWQGGVNVKALAVGSPSAVEEDGGDEGGGLLSVSSAAKGGKEDACRVRGSKGWVQCRPVETQAWQKPHSPSWQMPQDQ